MANNMAQQWNNTALMESKQKEKALKIKMNSYARSLTKLPIITKMGGKCTQEKTDQGCRL